MFPILVDNSVYLPASKNLVAVDFFAYISHRFYVLSVFDAEVHDFDRLRDCFGTSLPQACDWHIVFIIPEFQQLKVSSPAPEEKGTFDKSLFFRTTISPQFDKQYYEYRRALRDAEILDTDMQDAEQEHADIQNAECRPGVYRTGDMRMG